MIILDPKDTSCVACKHSLLLVSTGRVASIPPCHASQAEPVYWKLASGQSVCWSVQHLAEAHADELAKGDLDEAWRIDANK